MAEASGGRYSLEVREVSVTFGGLTALDHVSLDVQPGEVVGIIGPNGAGKTTLFNVICGFVRPSAAGGDAGRGAGGEAGGGAGRGAGGEAGRGAGGGAGGGAGQGAGRGAGGDAGGVADGEARRAADGEAGAGTVRYDGKDLPRRPDRRARLGIARTLQGLGLWQGLTVLENVMAGAGTHERAGFAAALLGLPRSQRHERARADAARRALDEVGLTGVEDRLPATLPHALQKKVVLARALVSEPHLLLLDEPASGLSSAEMTDLGREIRGLSQRMGVALVEHHMDLVMSVCDRVVVLELGRVIAEGSPAQVKVDPAVTTAYLGEAATDMEEGAVRLMNDA